MNAKIESIFNANVLFEISVSVCDGSYLVIYGEHINGYFCCIPNWGWCCEMTDPNDTCYNADRLQQNCGANSNVATGIAEAIKEAANMPAEKRKSLFFSL